jgi:hypothetical protein
MVVFILFFTLNLFLEALFSFILTICRQFFLANIFFNVFWVHTLTLKIVNNILFLAWVIFLKVDLLYNSFIFLSHSLDILILSLYQLMNFFYLLVHFIYLFKLIFFLEIVSIVYTLSNFFNILSELNFILIRILGWWQRGSFCLVWVRGRVRIRWRILKKIVLWRKNV